MEKYPIHLLTKMGVLHNFSISKKIMPEDINAMIKVLKGNAKVKSDQEILDLVRDKVMKEIIKATQNGSIPGLLIENNPESLVSIQHLEALNHMVIIVSQKLKNKKIDKVSLCYFINSLIGTLGLTEKDFEDFHRRIKNAGDSDENDDEKFEDN